jgi:hypothetical protein
MPACITCALLEDDAIIGRMGWFRRNAGRVKRGATGTASNRGVDDAVVQHLTGFAHTRKGVEAFIEPRTSVTQTTLLLVAFDGEWTRRVVPSPEWAHAFAEHLQLPGYDAAVVGYPQRMRDYNTRNKKHPHLR